MTRAGLAAATANQNLGGFKINQLGAGVAATDAVNVGQMNALLPPGMMAPYAAAAAPTGWLQCNGAAISRTTYATLFAAIGSAWGAGDGTTTFNVPNMNGRVPAGLDSAGTTLGFATAIAATGGEQTHALTTAELASHSHAASVTDPGHSHTYNASDTNTVTSFTAATAVITPPNTSHNTGSATTGITVSNANTGSGTAHNNVQPTATVLWCIKT